MKKDKYTELYLDIKDLNARGKHKDVIKYADRYLKLNDSNLIRGRKVRFMKARALRFLERYEEAIEILKEGMKEEMFFGSELFFLYYFLNRYEEAMELLPLIYEYENKTIKNYSISIMELVMKKQLGLDSTYKKGTHGDSIKEQIVNYNEQKAIEHIKAHSYNSVNDNNVESYFHKNVDIDYLIECVKENLKTSKKANKNENLEVHYFLLPNIGMYEDYICNYIKVILVPNTYNIVSMYPSSYMENDEVPILNCDFDILFSKKQKVKSL